MGCDKCSPTPGRYFVAMTLTPEVGKEVEATDDPSVKATVIDRLFSRVGTRLVRTPAAQLDLSEGMMVTITIDTGPAAAKFSATK
jgi:hypothetical protein